MGKFCANCGTQLAEEQKFCTVCGKNINPTESVQRQAQANNSNKGQVLKLILSVAVVVACLAYFGIYRIGPKINKNWAVDLACTEVKSDVYRNYGEIPTVSGRLLYNKDQDYIVIVKYKLSDIDWEGSCACHVYGYRESNCFLSGMTNEMAYDYNYNITELKALWAID